MSPDSAKARAAHIFLAPFGVQSRYMLRAYLRHVFTVISALMTIALAIDLWPQVAILADDPARTAPLAWAVARLAVLRVPDLLPPFIPFATFLGVVWAEVSFTHSRERMLIWNSGRPPLKCLAPALMLGLLMGAGLFAIDGFLRPAAIGVQIGEVLGREGKRLDRGQSGGYHWLALPDGLLRAEIDYGPPLRLHNATIYRLDQGGHLAEVNTAALATPLPGGTRWLLRDGHYWMAPQSRPDPGARITIGNPSEEEPEIPFAERTIPLSLNVQWLGNLGLSPQYIPLPLLRALAAAHIAAHEDGMYRTRVNALFGEILLPIAMAMLAASLSMMLFAFETPFMPVIWVLLAGYLAHFMSRALLLMGEFAYVPPFLAGWLAPLGLLALTGGVLYVIQKRRGRFRAHAGA